VKVVSGSESDLSWSQGVCAKAREAALHKAADSRARNVEVLMGRVMPILLHKQMSDQGQIPER
jgi:hypothetical protein